MWYKPYGKNYMKLHFFFLLSFYFYPIFLMLSLQKAEKCKKIIYKKMEALYVNFLFDQRRVNIEFNFSPISYTIYTRVGKEQGLQICYAAARACIR